MTRQRDTIVAVSSPPVACGEAAGKRDMPRAIVRLSGSSAIEFASRVFETSNGDLFVSGWRRVAGSVRWKNHTLAAHAYVMRSPKTYTREDIVELHLPALPWLVAGLLDQLLSAGARLAQPGEFTRRAFENGRISLDQAQAVGDLIASRSADEARAHVARLRSRAHSDRKSLRDEIEDLLSLVELGLDFSHEDVGVLKPEEMLARLKEIHQRIEQVSGEKTGSDADSPMLNAMLPRILLLGPTNAGKSSLFNRLLGRNAAIVSEERHTTRDIVEAPLQFSDGLSAVLVDSAGGGADIATLGPARPSEALRQAAWNATLASARTADVILLTVDRSALESQDGLGHFLEALAQAKPAACAVLWTKCDLPAVASVASPLEAAPRFEVSARSGEGVEALRDFLRAQVAALQARTQDASLATASSARAAARTAAEAVKRAADGLSGGHGEDIVAVELREAVHAFWQAEGVLLRHDAVTEAALDRIFARFCIGK